MDSETKSKWKKRLLIGAMAALTPGGFIVLGIYGIKNLLKRKESIMSRLKEITLEELTKWVRKNKHITWGDSSFEDKAFKKPGHLRGKYIRFNLDTRDMKIFRLELEGSGEPIIIDFRDDGSGNLLDELDRRLTEDGK